MGFLAWYYSLAILRLLFRLAFTLSYIKTIIYCWVLHFVGLYDFGESNSFFWQNVFYINSSSVSSISADTIRDHLPVITFRKFAEKFYESMGDDPVCMVCLSSLEEEDEVRELSNCHHTFHKNCLDKWLDHRQTTCPVCRSSLMPKRIPETEMNNSWVVDRIAYIFAEDLAIS